jgi:hypothetical protein
VSSVSFSSIKKSLIDFNNYEENITKVILKDKEIHQQAVASGMITDLTNYGFPQIEFTPEDWAISNWKIELADSAATTRNIILSYIKPVISKRFGDKAVLGARIHFIEGRFLSWASIAPPYEFYVSYDNGAFVNTESGAENEFPTGLLVNVGSVKYVNAWAYGLNYQHMLSVKTKNRDNNYQEYYLGSLYYDGWRNLTWLNPEFADKLEDRILKRVPLYPKALPYIILDSFIVYKPQIEEGGDFFVYVKDCVFEFERALIREDVDIDDEAVWGVLATERMTKRIRDLRLLSDKIQLFKLEGKKLEMAGTETK